MGRAPTDFCSRFHQNKRSDGDIVDACGACQMLCEAEVIDFDQQDEVIELDVGAITGRHFTTEQIVAQIEGLFRVISVPVEARKNKSGLFPLLVV